MMKLAAGFLLLLLEGERLGLTCPGLKTRVNPSLGLPYAPKRASGPCLLRTLFHWFCLHVVELNHFMAWERLDLNFLSLEVAGDTIVIRHHPRRPDPLSHTHLPTSS